MGQTVVVHDLVEMGDLLVIDTDRSFTGQDGVALTPSQAGEAVPGRLAQRLFALDPGIDHVFVLQNTVTIRRPGGWDQTSKTQVQTVVEGFLLFYDEET
jgi:hypothetical protein